MNIPFLISAVAAFTAAGSVMLTIRGDRRRAHLSEELNAAIAHILNHDGNPDPAGCRWCELAATSVRAQRFHVQILASDDPAVVLCADPDCFDPDCRRVDAADAVLLWPMTPLGCADPECTEPSCRRQDPGA